MSELSLPADLVDRILAGHQPTPEQARSADHAKEEVARIAADISATFATPAGQSTLAWLRRVTVEQSAFVPGWGRDGLSAEQQGFLREGQNSIYREILRYMQIHREGGDA